MPPWLARAVESPETGGTLPPWKPGELELHFIYTGCGENCFYRLPDGTAPRLDNRDAPELRLRQLTAIVRKAAEKR